MLFIYFNSISIITMITVGYGDITPVNSIEKIFVVMLNKFRIIYKFNIYNALDYYDFNILWFICILCELNRIDS